MSRRVRRGAAVVALLLVGTAALLWPRHDAGLPPSASFAALPPSEKIARGAYLARAGDCMACHTVRGGAEYAGGRVLETPFGAIVSPNLTQDAATGIGSWSADDFWNALHNGRARDGRLLYPAFPYPNYTAVTRDDSEALYAYFRTIPAVRRPNEPHRLRFPYDSQVALAFWRALYFKPGVTHADPAQSPEWHRGAYLVQGLGHCSACHSPRDALGGSKGRNGGDLSGGLVPMLGWYAPSLASDAEAGLGSWPVQEIAQLLHTGVAPRATVSGPMAEVVRESLQYLSAEDVRAMAVYLKSLPAANAAPERPERSPAPQAVAFLAAGAKLYEQHCATCHGPSGRGAAPHYPPLAGNRALTMPDATNAIRLVLNGGFPPGTRGNPRPYGMPPFGHVLADVEVAQVVSYLRSDWGNDAPPVSGADVNRLRAVPLD
ncbi:mono/diheme cytochrome c family protein [Pseudoduganella lurida]|uniref:Mono/diheme cytochrome c family protein n=1 Tax=Pseudoduganella lurida TaxID=1036180 RepID=A0A562RM66_9BURK|nr:cytochrome c [Pseudoduganella lurida]TWI70099.1 mono/diheme cytochrome c family protein [Pseudoduganella lurida]